MSSKYNLKKAHEHSSLHRQELEESVVCACFYCLSRFNPAEIEEWLDWPKEISMDDQTDANGRTAICPMCGVDAVLGDKSGYPLTDEFLREMHELWFNS